MTGQATGVNMAAVGFDVRTRDGVFGADTPRGILADVFDEQGRGWPARLLRSGWPLQSCLLRGVRRATVRLFDLVLASGLDTFGGVYIACPGQPITAAELEEWLAAGRLSYTSRRLAEAVVLSEWTFQTDRFSLPGHMPTVYAWQAPGVVLFPYGPNRFAI